jgi:hypothetical protein
MACYRDSFTFFYLGLEGQKKTTKDLRVTVLGAEI